MDGLDFGGLTDDQLLGLIRASLREAADRHPAVAQAAHDAILDEGERLEAMRQAGEAEAARLREAALQRAAAEAAASVRRAHEELEREITALRGAGAGDEAARRARETWRQRNADLIRRVAAMRDATDLHPALQEALSAALLEQEDQDRVIRAASESEAARLRALERSRLAEEAARKIREDKAALEREIQAARNSEAAERARQAEVRRQAEQRDWLRRAAELVELPPSDITVLLVDTYYGRRVLIDPGNDTTRTTNHLSDWLVGGGRLRTVQRLIRRKPDLAAYSAELAEAYRGKTVRLVGAHHTWEEQTP